MPKTFDNNFIKQWEKALSALGPPATARSVSLGNGLWLIETVWEDGTREIGRFSGIVNTNTGSGTITTLEFDERFQQRGIYSTCVATAAKLWTERGIARVSATPRDDLSSAILQTGGFTPPEDDLGAFDIDLEGERVQEFLAYRDGGDEPQWRKEVSRRVDFLARRDA